MIEKVLTTKGQRREEDVFGRCRDEAQKYPHAKDVLVLQLNGLLEAG
jgi:hypothetical protein